MSLFQEKGHHAGIDAQEDGVPRNRDPERLRAEVLERDAARDSCHPVVEVVRRTAYGSAILVFPFNQEALLPETKAHFRALVSETMS